MDELCTKLEWNREARLAKRVNTSSEAIARFEHTNRQPLSAERRRSRKPSGTGTDHDDIELRIAAGHGATLLFIPP